jgi:hypothetical protein
MSAVMPGCAYRLLSAALGKAARKFITQWRPVYVDCLP